MECFCNPDLFTLPCSHNLFCLFFIRCDDDVQSGHALHRLETTAWLRSQCLMDFIILQGF